MIHYFELHFFLHCFQGHHVYMDASSQKINATAQLISPSFINDRHMCLSFYYAMYGRDVNQLNVYVAQEQTRKLYWTLSGNQGEDWHHQLVEIGASPQPTQVIFEGVVGVSDEGDIDLDDIWIFHGSCPPLGNYTLCFLFCIQFSKSIFKIIHFCLLDNGNH